MVRFLLRDTSVHVLFNDSGEEFIEASVASLQGDAICGTFFNISFDKKLSTLRNSYVERPKLPTELIYTDDTEFIKISREEKRILKEHREKSLC